MLLPSDVARLVLGYLQQEGLNSTSRAFILESPNLREYAEHSSEDGAIPACVFSLFGKNLTTILNEYVAVKTKETCQENQIPAMMTSLWKKLDFTLNQIKSMQNSPAVQQIQRLRTQNSIQNMRRQRSLSASQSSSTGCLSVSAPGICVSSPVPAPQGMLGHSTPVCYTSQHTRPSTISLSHTDSTLQIIVPDHRFTPGPLSPARRKCDSPRRRGGGQIGTSRGTAVSSTLCVESQSQEAVTENLSQMVIENAREKILNDRSLQEKLAENINKILASDNSPQITKAACSTVEQEQSIDEILGLQGEIHMTDDAIQDILEQTESDPAFQALFDLFDYGKSKTSEVSEQTDGNLSNSAQGSDETGHADSATDTGTGHEDSTSGTETTTRKLTSKNVQDAKSKRKSSVPLSAGRLISAPSQSHLLTKRTAAAKGITQTKKGTARTRVSVSGKQTRSTNSKKGQLNKVDSESSEQNTSSSVSEEGTSMEVDELQGETSHTPQKMPQSVPQGESRTTKVTNKKSSNNDSEKHEDPATSIGTDSGPEKEGAEKTEKQNTGALTALEAAGQSMCESFNIRMAHNADVHSRALSQKPVTNMVPVLGLQKEESGPRNAKTSSPGGVFSEPSLLVAPGSAANSTPSATDHVSQSPTSEPDPNKIVALKIIISDEQEEQSSDSALNQAVSSISGDRIPTIFLSSPAKSPAKVLPHPTSSITPEETALAVSSLQGTEAISASAISVQNYTPLSQFSQPQTQNVAGQEAGFIQLLPANAAFGGQSSYFVVSDPTAATDHSSMMLLPTSAAPSTSQLVATPPRSRAVVTMAANVSQTFSPASAIIISSPVQPMLQNMAVPVSVFGQNNTGKLTVLPNQVLALPGPTLVNQQAKVGPKPKLMPKDSVELGKIGTPGSCHVSNSSLNSEQLKSASGASPGHRRILCFDENTDKTNTTNTSTTATASTGVKEHMKTNQSYPCISGNSGARRRIEKVGSPEQNHISVTNESQKETRKHMQKEKEHHQTADTSISSNNALQDPSISSKSKERKEATLNTVDGLAVSADTSQNLNSCSQAVKHKCTKTMKETSLEAPHERRPPKTPEEPPESSTTQDSPGIMANKENEVEGRKQELHQATASSMENISSKARPSTPASQGVSGKTFCKTSPLTRQAVEMLQGIQSQSPTATTPKRKATSCLDLPVPRTPGSGRLQEDILDSLRTPSRQRLGRETEGTPKHLAPPSTPDIPSCSPASEAGSENSINMAAHTLMILSRAARTGGPLKDSLRQEEAGALKSSASKSKKRKYIEPSPTAKKELQLSGSSGSKKKAKKQKKLLDSFPHDLDVDKFLSSLHYDE